MDPKGIKLKGEDGEADSSSAYLASQEFKTDQEEDSDEYEDASSSSDEEVVIINPSRKDYIEIPRSKGEPPPITRPLNGIPRSQLLQFWSLYNKQPEYIKEMVRLHFYRRQPIVHPSPLSVFIQKVRTYKTRRKMQKLAKKKLEEQDKPPQQPKIPKRSQGKIQHEVHKTDKEAKVSYLDLFETDTKLIHVDYPGRVVNPEKAVATMGGLNNITRVFSNFNKKLPVRFRPEDPYCNAATAEAHPTVGILIKVKRRKPLPKPKVVKSNETLEHEQQIIDLEDEKEETRVGPRTVLVNGVPWTKAEMLKEDERLLKDATERSQHMLKQWNVRGDPEQYYVKVPKDHQPKVDSKLRLETAGIVYRTYKFEGICDFQFLPMKKTKDGMISTRERVIPLIGKPGGESPFVAEDLFSGRTELERFLLPTFMSRIDVPQNTAQEQFLDADRVKKVPEMKEHKDIITTSRQKRNVYTLSYSFQSDKAKNPVPSEPLENALEDVSKRRLHGSAMTLVRRCFERRPIWTKIALEYETQLPSLTLKYVLPCVSYFANSGPWRSLWVRLGFDPRDDPSTFLYQTVDFRVPICYKQYIDERERADDSSFIFRATVVPPKSQMFYQICDLKCDEIERVIDIATERMGKYELEYDGRFGWLKEGTFDYIRHVLVQYIEVQLEEMGKIPEYPVKKIYLPNGELELKEKLQSRPRDIKRLRRVKGPKPKSEDQTTSPTSARFKDSKKSKNKNTLSSTWAYQGILQDLSIKDLSSFDCREDMDVILDENLDDALASAEEEEDSASEDELDDDPTRLEDVFFPLKLDSHDH